MKILTINCKPDLSYFTSRGLNLETTYKKVNKVFPVESGSDISNSTGNIVSTAYPNPTEYLERYNTGEFKIMMVGYNRNDYRKYKKQMANTGGKTFLMPMMPYRTYVIVYCTEENRYAIHELHHALCAILLTQYGFIVHDYMDLDKQKRPYFLDTEPENPLSNYAQTWAEIEPYINLLNGTPMKTAILTRQTSDNKQTLGQLVCVNGNLTFSCKTLELADKNNQRNISCIPKGLYKVSKTFSLKFGNVYEVQNVPNRTSIYIHHGNYYTDILGCILVGNAFSDINKDGELDVINSKVTRSTLEKFFNFEDFTLIVK